MKRITKREAIAFFLGFLSFLLIDVITNWQTHKDAFKKGYDSVRIEVDK